MHTTLKHTLVPLLVAACASCPAAAQDDWQTYSGYDEYGGSPAFGAPKYTDGWHASVAGDWESRYLQRGYQQFGNSGAFAIMLGGGYGPIGADLEQRFSDSSADREFRGRLRAGHSFDDFDFAVSATYVSDLRGGPSEWEFAFGIGGDLVFGIRWDSELMYGTGPDNFLADAGLSREWDLTADWSLRASAGLGLNLGYHRDAAKGLDHALIGLDIARSFGTHSAIYGGVGYHAPINRDEVKYLDHADLYDGILFHIGMRLQY